MKGEEQPGLAAAQAFLDALAGKSGARFSFQTYDDDPERALARLHAARTDRRLYRRRSPLEQVLHGPLVSHWTNLYVLNQHGAGVFVTVSKTNGMGRTFDDIASVPGALRAVWCSAVAEREWPLAPSITVETLPGRFDYYWLIAPGQCTWGQHRAIMHRMARLHGCDPQAVDPTTALRVPGFLAWGDGEPFQVRAWPGMAYRYELSKILLALGRDEEPQALDDPVIERILEALRKREHTRTELRDLFCRHRGGRVSAALTELETAGRITRRVQQTTGRPVTRWKLRT